MTKPAVLLANAGDARDLLDIDNEVRLGPAGAKLNQQIGPARQDLGAPTGFAQDTHGLLDRRRRYITEHDFGVSS